MSDVDRLRFLGLSKTQFLGILVLLLAVNFAVQGYSLVKQSDLADQGMQSHVALCAFTVDLQQRLESNQKFLDLSEQQRVAKYGEALGRIPEAVIRKSIHDQQAVLESLSALHCSRKG